MAMTAWSAKVVTQLDLLVAERAHDPAGQDDDHRSGLPRAADANAEDRAIAAVARGIFSVYSQVFLSIR